MERQIVPSFHRDGLRREFSTSFSHPILQRLRQNKYLKRLAIFVGPNRRRSSSRFLADLAAITSLLTTNLCDVLFLVFSRVATAEVVRRHGDTFQALEIVHDMVVQPAVLTGFGFSEEQCATTVQLLGAFAGSGGIQACAPDDAALRSRAAKQAGHSEEAPFMVPLLFLLISRQFPAMAAAECLGRARFGFWSDDRRTFFPDLSPSASIGVRWGVLTKPVLDLGAVCVSFVGPAIDAIRFVDPWPVGRFREGRHFMDERFSLPLAEGSTTVFQTKASSDGLAWAKPHWYRYFGDEVAGELETIIDGHFCVAKEGLPMRPIFMRNHPSFENNLDAQRVLIRIITQWFDAGTLEYVCRWHRLPQCILALGAVPKNTEPFWRVVTDARPINVYARAWRVKNATVSDLCLMMSWNALMTVRDLEAAYHLVRLGGCRGNTRYLTRWVTNHSKTGYMPVRTIQTGCGPGDCLGWCDKSLMALCVAGHVGRFANSQFGHKVSNTGLAILTDVVVKKASKEWEIDSGAFVDDFLNSLMVMLHALCKGLEGGCPVCRAAAEAAQPKFDALDKMMMDCALIFSQKGDMSVKQRHVFLGIIFDTHKGRLFVTIEKFEKLMVLLKEIRELLTCSPRGLAKLRGKAQHQFRCIEGVRPFLVRLDNFIGGPGSAYEWDREKELPEELRHTLGFLYQHLPARREAGAEMWPMEPCTVYYRWQRGLLTPYGDLVVGTWDAADTGVAIAVSIAPGVVYRLSGMRFEGVSTIVTFEDTPEAQVHREAAGAPMVMRLLRRLFNLEGLTVLLRNDCAPVIYALQKGSSSARLQLAAEAVCREGLEAKVARILYLHVPGVQLIAEGVDGGSREGALRLLGPACTAGTREKIRELLAAHGWRITLDLFAAQSNAFVERFASWTDEPNSEQVDAFYLGSWNQSSCACGREHRETVFIFPPRGMERVVVRRAKSDGVRGCFVVPTDHKAGYWKLLRGRSVARLALNKPEEAFDCVQAPMAAHTVFLVDFGASDGVSPGCGQEFGRRGRRALWGPGEADEFSQLRELAASLR